MKLLSSKESQLISIPYTADERDLAARLKRFDSGRLNSVVLIALAIVVAASAISSGLESDRGRVSQAEVTEADLLVLRNAQSLISVESHWSRSSDVSCTNVMQMSLYCALEQATEQLLGESSISKATLKEVQFAIERHSKYISSSNPIVDFNSSKTVSFDDINSVLTEASHSIQEKLNLAASAGNSKTPHPLK